MLRSYGPAAVAASSSLFKPLRNVNTSSLHADVPLDDIARRKKYDDLGLAPGSSSRSIPREILRLYSQEVASLSSTRQDRRFHSASAALDCATGGTANESANSSYTHCQLRQRRLELERELAALDDTSLACSELSDAGLCLWHDSRLRQDRYPLHCTRETDLSSQSSSAYNPLGAGVGLKASTTFELSQAMKWLVTVRYCMSLDLTRRDGSGQNPSSYSQIV